MRHRSLHRPRKQRTAAAHARACPRPDHRVIDARALWPLFDGEAKRLLWARIALAVRQTPQEPPR